MSKSMSLKTYLESYDADLILELDGKIYTFVNGDDDFIIFDKDTFSMIGAIGACSSEMDDILKRSSSMEPDDILNLKEA